MSQNSDDLTAGPVEMDKLVALCKRRGFIFQSSEIYGGINGFWDYGPLGVELKRNIKDAWWADAVRKRDDMVGLDCSIIMNPKVWEASGHLGGFADPMVDCKESKKRYRADKVWVVGFYSVADWESAQKLLAKVVSLQRESTEYEARLTEIVDSLSAGTEDAGPIRSDLARLALEVAEATDSSDLIKARLPRNTVPTLCKAVEADTEEEARSLAVGLLKRKEGDLLGPSPESRCGADTVMDLPQRWPRVSPATQQETLTEPRQFNLMFKTYVGAMEDQSAIAYLRPETAQGIFANYKNVLDTSRLKLPFGIAQIGKAFRNEINPRNYTFRSREFEQMEIEFFCHPNEADKWYAYWRQARFDWYVNLGLRSDRLRLRDHESDELAHYAAACADIEYAFPFGVSELEGVANRTDFDLKAHQEKSGKDLTYFDDETKERFIPYVIEPSGGVDRAALAFLCEAYCQDTAPDEKGKPQSRTVMKFHPRLAPIKVAVFPLVKKEGMPEIARKIYADCKAAALASFYDEKGAVGRRYRRQDEAGTPFCVTVDGQTLEDQTVTIRERDSLKQVRIAADKVIQYIQEHLC